MQPTLKVDIAVVLGHKGLGRYNLPFFCSQDIFGKRKRYY